MSQTHFRPRQQGRSATDEGQMRMQWSTIRVVLSLISIEFFPPSFCRRSVSLEHRRLWCQRAHKVQRRLESWTVLNGRTRDREERGRRWRRRKWRAVLTLGKKMCDAAEQQQQQQPRRLRDTGGAADVPAGPRSCGGGHRVNASVTQSAWQVCTDI